MTVFKHASPSQLNKDGDEDENSQQMAFDHQNPNIRHRKVEDTTNTNEVRFQVERRMEFTSTRKRMSILVKDPRDQHYKLYIKGADQEI